MQDTGRKKLAIYVNILKKIEKCSILTLDMRGRMRERGRRYEFLPSND